MSATTKVSTAEISDHSTPALHRAEGEVRLRFVAGELGGTALSELYQRGSLRARQPRCDGIGPRETVLINTAGGLTGGDRMAVTVTVGDAAAAVVASQASERVYRSSGGVATIENRLRVGAGGALDWLPQDTILFNGGRLRRRLVVDLAADARLVAVESTVLGRRAMGEEVTRGLFTDRWRVRREERLVYADDLRLSFPAATVTAGPATLAGRTAIAVVALVAPDAERRLATARAALDSVDATVDAGVSAVEGILVARLIAFDGRLLRGALTALLAAFRDGAALPRVWTI